MTEIQFTTEMNVQYVSGNGGDLDLARAAWVSLQGQRAEDEANTEKVAGLINYLIEKRHGTPFEHASLTFLVEAPIFVFREWHRHRIGQSYNELSGRYSVLPPKFYVPDEHRPLVNVGSSARPKFEQGTLEQYRTVVEVIEENCIESYKRYEALLESGVAKEVARSVLPVNIFSAMYVTMNPRSLMAFLSLRVDSPDSTFETKPQWEINNCADKIEEIFSERFPLTHAAFVKHGRVGP